MLIFNRYRNPGAYSEVAIVARRKRIAAVAALVGVAAIVAGSLVATAQSGPAALTSLVPQDTQMVGAIQANWLWDNTASIRKTPAVSKIIAEAETHSGLSIQDDIEPWAGQIGVAGVGLGKDTSKANITIYVQIRDQIKFMTTVAKIQERLKNPPADAKPGSIPTIAPRDYNGITVYDFSKPGASAKVAAEMKDHPVSVAVVDGWAIAGIGKGAIEHAIDVYQGRSPSIQSSAVWSPVIAKLPPNANAWFGLDMTSLQKLAGTAVAPAVPGVVAESLQNTMAFAFTDEGNGFRVDAVGAPQTAKGKAMYAQMASNLPDVTGQIFKRVPNAVIALTFTNPAYYWTLIKKSILDTATDAKERKAILQGYRQASSIESTVPYFHKDAGIVFTWRKDRGFGLVLLARADTHDAALHAASAIVKALKQTGIPMQRGGNSWAAEIPGLDMMVPPTIPVKLSPFLSAKDDWLVVGSSPSWTAPSSTAPNFELPASAAGSPGVTMVTMKWLPSLLDLIEQQAPPDDLDVKQGFALVRGLHLETAGFICMGHIDPAGRWSQMTTEVTNWDWHAAIDNTVTAAENWKHSPPKGKGHNLLKPNISLSGTRPVRQG